MQILWFDGVCLNGLASQRTLKSKTLCENVHKKIVFVTDMLKSNKDVKFDISDVLFWYSTCAIGDISTYLI